MIEETKKIYRCEYCKKVYFRKNACIEHEERCYKNPINYRACLSCFHLEKRTAKTIFENSYTSEIIKKELFYCSKIDSYLYPPIVEIKKNWIIEDDIADGKINKPMLKECKIFNDELELDIFKFKQ